MRYRIQPTKEFSSKFEATYAGDPAAAEAMDRLWARLETSLPYPKRAVANRAQWLKVVREPLDGGEWDLCVEVEVVLEDAATRVRLLDVGKAPHGGLPSS